MSPVLRPSWGFAVEPSSLPPFSPHSPQAFLVFPDVLKVSCGLLKKHFITKNFKRTTMKKPIRHSAPVVINILPLAFSRFPSFQLPFSLLLKNFKAIQRNRFSREHIIRKDLHVSYRSTVLLLQS